MTQKELMNIVVSDLAALKQGMPANDISKLETRIDKVQDQLQSDIQELEGEMKDELKDIKSDISAIKNTLLNPEDGQVVKTNQNTAFRRKWEQNETIIQGQKAEFEDLKRWKGGVTKALWIIFGSIIALFIKTIFQIDVNQ
jgi:hypothetical protein